MTRDLVPRGSAPVALFHPAFEAFGGAEILVATQARYLKESGLDTCVATMAFEPARWQTWLEGIAVRVAAPPPFYDGLTSALTRLQRSVPRANSILAGCRKVMAVNFPCNVLLGASNVTTERLWCCTEPSRKWHLVATSPRLHERVTRHPNGTSDVERYYPPRLAQNTQARATRNGAALVDFDIAMTRKLDAVYSISEFARDTMQRVYGRTDPGVIYPMVRFPTGPERTRSGLDRSGLRVLTHSRLETLKNVENVLRGFALFAAKGNGGALHVVGEGPERERLEKLAQTLGVAGVTRFHGYLSEQELAKVYDACDVFALQPLDEPFGMVFPEAAARGLLLVGPDHGGPFEILDGGRLGDVCDPFEPASVAEAFARIWALSDAEVDAQRARADEACRDRYSVASIGPKLRALLA